MFKSRTKEARRLQSEKYKDKIEFYRQAHREEAKEYSRQYRLRRKAKGLPNGKAAIWFKRIADRDGAVCKHCGTLQNLSVNHIVPQCVGGKYSYDNLEILCKICNVKEYHRLVQKALKEFFKQTT